MVRVIGNVNFIESKNVLGIQRKNGKGLGFVNIRVPNMLEMGEFGYHKYL